VEPPEPLEPPIEVEDVVAVEEFVVVGELVSSEQAENAMKAPTPSARLGKSMFFTGFLLLQGGYNRLKWEKTDFSFQPGPDGSARILAERAPVPQPRS
jgi:hypothetical protein